ncbi:MAG: methyltetrahydrofolate cobalamin methyltransferase [Anaerolineales bacterium]|nr:methyltetrahydrofolate cobalamin methyltransferase [Anaerolineales bacterium]MDW8445838.1 methyltetrahydrofolate cobalamin methyltransferase [Anaerolineales bacterium]
MKIIGEKINGTRKRVAQAIAERDRDYIADLAKRQAEAGATWLDVNAGTHPSQEADDLLWLIEVVQSVTDTPLSLDSANPKALRAAISAVQKTPLINSISGEPERLEGILPIVAEHGCDVIALAMDAKKIPESSEKRLEVIHQIMAETRRYGIPDERVYIDPLAMTISTNTDSALIALDTMRRVRQEYPAAHLTIGLSNISFGLPARAYINRVFLVMAMAAGLDSAILDPLDREIQAMIVTAELLLGKDKHCLNFIRAHRKGIFESPSGS